MAKLDEVDPRWIVADRQDGKNVNSWHWEERDLSKNVHDSFKAMFASFPLIEDEALSLRLKEVTDISGDVTVAQRKGKIMCYFELKMTIKWGGKVDGKSVDGKLTMPEIEHDNFRDDFEISVTVTDNNAESKKADEWIRSNARQVVRSKVKAYFEEVFKTHKVGTAVPKSGGGADSPAPQAVQPSSGAPKQSTPVTKAPASKPSGSSTSINWKMQWRVPIDELFAILMNEQRAAIYTRAPAKINPQSGGGFEFLAGVISGYYVKVEAPTSVTMQWRLSSWPAGTFSSVVIALTKEEPGVTRLDFAQAGIPEGEVERVEQGWRINFFDAIKMVFGFGMEYL